LNQYKYMEPHHGLESNIIVCYNFLILDEEINYYILLSSPTKYKNTTLNYL